MNLLNNIELDKFLYEIKFRKADFLKECISKDLNYDSTIDVTAFKMILENFTFYLNKEEIEILGPKVLTDGKINYINLTNRKSYVKDIYKDILLMHLNENSEEENRKDIKPLKELNNQYKEDNFVIKVSKNILDFFIQNSPNGQEEKYIKAVFNKYDFDNDGLYSIGELMYFIEFCEIDLTQSELRFLYEKILNAEKHLKLEQSFKSIVQFTGKQLMMGKFSFDTFFKFVMENYQKVFHNLDSHFKNDLMNDYEIKENRNTQNILHKCQFIKIIVDSLKIFGIEFLLNYFSKYLDCINGIMLINITWLEIGYINMGYSNIEPSDIGNFKYFCLKKNFCKMKSLFDAFMVQIEILFKYLIAEYKIDYCNVTDKNQQTICKNVVFDEATKFINTFVFNKDQSNDELTFRREFIKKFEFVNHKYMDFLTNLLDNKFSKNLNDNFYRISNNENNINKFQYDKYTQFSKILKLKYIDLTKLEALNFNYLFVGLIDNYDTAGLLLDNEDILILNQIKEKIEKKIYFSDENINQISFDISKKMNEEQILFKTENNPIVLENNNLVLLKKSPTIKKNKNKIMSNSKTSINSVVAIPEIYSLCIQFISTKYNIQKDSLANIDFLASLGICSIFRELITNKGYNQRIEYLEIIEVLKTLDLTNETITFIGNWLKNLIFKDNHSKEYIDLKEFYKSLEDILLDYSKICKNILYLI